RDDVPIPPGTDPRLVGAAVRDLALAGLIRSAGRRRSRRPEAHGGQVDVWAVTDRAAALAWLAAHPDTTDPEPDAPAPGSSPRPPPLFLLHPHPGHQTCPEKTSYHQTATTPAAPATPANRTAPAAPTSTPPSWRRMRPRRRPGATPSTRRSWGCLRTSPGKP